MPESNSDTQQEDRGPRAESAAGGHPETALLRFRKPLIVLSHAIAFAASLLLSFLMAHNMEIKQQWLLEQFPPLLFFVLLIKLPVFALFKQYRGWWRYVGISELGGIVRASLISTLVIVGLWFLVFIRGEGPTHEALRGIANVSQGVFMADMFGTVLILSGLRMIIRLYYEEFRTVEAGRLKRFLIVGAGNTGETLLRDIHRMQVIQYEVVGFIDDDAAKQGISIHGIPVLGTVERLPEICENRNIEEIAIAMPTASHQELRRVIQVCEGTKIRFRTVPSLTDIASGKFRVSQIRDVDINDLLGREAVQLDLDLIEAFARNKTILVTGAGGSIGSEMCRQLCKVNPQLLLLIEQAENPLFYIERELRRDHPSVA